MASKNTYKLTAPGGTKVEVESAVRRDTLLARGYTEGHGTKSTATKSSGDTSKN